MVQTYVKDREIVASEPVITTPAVASATVVTPTDRVRWGPIVAGLFAAMSALVVLGILGLAIGLSNVDAGDRPSNFGIGAGIWGAVSALLAFFFGGWMAARTAARHREREGEHNGLLQGAMVWMVAVPLMVYLLAGGIGSLFKTAGNVAATGAQAAATTAAGAASDPAARQDMQSAANDAADNLQAKAAEVRQQVTPQRVEDASHKAARGAWGTLASLLLGLAAASFGGHVGTRGPTVRRDVA
jgi:hypothetical protein